MCDGCGTPVPARRPGQPGPRRSTNTCSRACHARVMRGSKPRGVCDCGQALPTRRKTACSDACAARHDRARRTDPSRRAAARARQNERRHAPSERARRRDAYAAWAAANPDVKANSRHAYRARRRGAHVDDVDRRVVWERDNGICHICRVAADPADWHLDHVIPLSRGGAHAYDNVAVSHPACNIRKGASLPT